jgi:hypothetical protein
MLKDRSKQWACSPSRQTAGKRSSLLPLNGLPSFGQGRPQARAVERVLPMVALRLDIRDLQLGCRQLPGQPAFGTSQQLDDLLSHALPPFLLAAFRE